MKKIEALILFTLIYICIGANILNWNNNKNKDISSYKKDNIKDISISNKDSLNEIIKKEVKKVKAKELKII